MIDAAHFALGCGARDTESMPATRPGHRRWRAMMAAAEISGALLRARPLPRPANDGKEERGRLLVVAGSAELPGAALLTAEAGVRAGAGKVKVAAPAESMAALGMALPEARVTGLSAKPSAGLFEGRDAVVVGPGMAGKEARRWADAALVQAGDAPSASRAWRRQGPATSWPA